MKAASPKSKAFDALAGAHADRPSTAARLGSDDWSAALFPCPCPCSCPCPYPCPWPCCVATEAFQVNGSQLSGQVDEGGCVAVDGGCVTGGAAACFDRRPVARLRAPAPLPCAATTQSGMTQLTCRGVRHTAGVRVIDSSHRMYVGQHLERVSKLALHDCGVPRRTPYAEAQEPPQVSAQQTEPPSPRTPCTQRGALLAGLDGSALAWFATAGVVVDRRERRREALRVDVGFADQCGCCMLVGGAAYGGLRGGLVDVEDGVRSLSGARPCSSNSSRQGRRSARQQQSRSPRLSDGIACDGRRALYVSLTH
eukprot:7382380-Prymnesium_polylepis.2